MKPFYKLWALCLLCLSVSCAYAQSDTSQQKSSFSIGVNYLSNDVYLGRGDTVSTPTISPNINYTFKNGLYFAGSVNYITNRTKNKFDWSSLEAGYDHQFNESFEAGLSFTKFFYSSNSTLVSSTISSTFNAYADYNIAGILTPTVNAFYNIGKNGYSSDFVLNPSLSHDFELGDLLFDDDDLTISPQAGMSFGSQNYYAGYLEKKNKLGKRAAAAQNAAYNQYYDGLSEFKLLFYEIALPIEYNAGIFNFTVKPSYLFVQNSLPQSTTAERVITQNIELGSPYKANLLYVEVGLALKF